MAKEKTITAQVVVENMIQRNGRTSFVDSDRQWYGYGFEKPEFSKGDTVQFEYIQNGQYRNVVKGSLEVVAPAEQTPSPKTKASVVDVMTRDDYWARKESNDVFTQREIRYQASRNAAIEWIELLLAQQAIPLGSKKVSDKEELLLEYLNHYTNMFYSSTFGVRGRNEESFEALNDSVDTEEEEMDSDLAQLS